MDQDIRIETITPEKALQDRSWCIVGTYGVYELYRDQDTAMRVCADLNRRYGHDAYYVAHVESEPEHKRRWFDSDVDYLCDMCANDCDERKVIRVGQSAYAICEKWVEDGDEL